MLIQGANNSCNFREIVITRGEKIIPDIFGLVSSLLLPKMSSHSKTHHFPLSQRLYSYVLLPVTLSLSLSFPRKENNRFSCVFTLTSFCRRSSRELLVSPHPKQGYQQCHQTPKALLQSSFQFSLHNNKNESLLILIPLT